MEVLLKIILNKPKHLKNNLLNFREVQRLKYKTGN